MRELAVMAARLSYGTDCPERRSERADDAADRQAAAVERLRAAVRVGAVDSTCERTLRPVENWFTVTVTVREPADEALTQVAAAAVAGAEHPLRDDAGR